MNHRTSPTLLVCCLAYALSSTTHGDSIRTVALSGSHAPGTPPGVTFDSFEFRYLGAIDSIGQTAFVARLAGTEVESSNDIGIWSEGGGGGLELVAREGDPALGMGPGVNFTYRLASIWFLQNVEATFNGLGQTAFYSTVDGNGVDATNDFGIWSQGGGGTLELVAREGDSAPDTGPGVNFEFSGPTGSVIRLNDLGQSAFYSRLTGTGVDSTNDSGIWSQGDGGGLSLVARKGDPAPGIGSGVNFGNLDYSPVLNSVGQTAFNAGLIGTGIDSTNNGSIWLEVSGGGLELVAREGDSAPGTGSGVVFGDDFFDSFSRVLLNDLGQTAFEATLTGTGVTRTNHVGIWSEGGGGGLELVARAGDPAPGAGPGVNFGNTPGFSPFFGSLRLNGLGQTAFNSRLVGIGVDSTNDYGIWAEGDNGLTLVAREGDPALGTDEGVVFGYSSPYGDSITNPFSVPVLNGVGGMVFGATLIGTGVDSTNNSGIWAQDPNGILTLIARKGDVIDVSDGPGSDFRTIAGLSFADGLGNESGHSTAFNDLGQLVFNASFTDGSSGVFVTNLVAVPEPGALALAVMGLLWSFSRRR